MAFTELLIFETVPGPVSHIGATATVALPPPIIVPQINPIFSVVEGRKIFTADAPPEVFSVKET